MAGTTFLVEPADALTERRRLFDAVGRLYDADFVGQDSGAHIAGCIRFGDANSEVDKPLRPSLVLLGSERERGAVVFHDLPGVPDEFKGRRLEDSAAGSLSSCVLGERASV